MSRTSTTVALGVEDLTALSRRPPTVPPSTFVLQLVRDDVRLDGEWRGAPISVSRRCQVATICLSLPDELRTEIEGRIPPGVPVGAYMRSLLRGEEAHVVGDEEDQSAGDGFEVDEAAHGAREEESLATQTRELRRRVERLQAEAAARQPRIQEDPTAAPGSVTWTCMPEGTPVQAEELIEALRTGASGVRCVDSASQARSAGGAFRSRRSDERYAVGVDAVGRPTCPAPDAVEGLLGEFARALAATASRRNYRIEATYRVSGSATVGWVAHLTVLRTE